MARRLLPGTGGATAAGVLLAAVLLLAPPASANTYTIPAGAGEADAADGICSLTEAAQAANTDAVDNECPAGTGSDVILLSGGIYVVSNLELGDPTASQSTTVKRLGAAPVTIESQSLSKVMTINGGSGGVTISGVTIRGGVLNVNSALGAGIAVGGGPFTLTDSTVTDNVATGTGDSGGGIAAGVGAGPMTLVDDTISGNSATGDGGGIVFGNGSGSQLTLESVTIADNHANSDGIGGGNGGGIARVGFAPAMTLHDTIVADNTGGGAPDCVGFASGGAITRSGNLIGDLSGCAYPTPGQGDITGVDPLLAPRADNGGPTPTQALLGGSPAIDHAVAPCPATDQRGVPRPQLAGCDIGAYELEPAATPAVESPSPSSPSPVQPAAAPAAKSAPQVRVSCPKSAGPGGCRFALEAVAGKPKRVDGKLLPPKAESAVAKVKLGAGKSALVILTPKPKFAAKLAAARKLLVREVETVDGSTHTTYRILKVVG